MKRINIWSSPRNISTAFMYAWAQREDTTVVDEPLYAHYLTHTDTEAEHPGTPEILASQHRDANKVVDEVIFGEYETSNVLFKQMTHHLINIENERLFDTENVLLIRDPRRIIASYAKVIPNPKMSDIGVQMQYDLYEKLKSKRKFTAIVDARQLLLNPPKVLAQLCERLGIDFQEKMLTWQAGERAEDGVWAKYWYANVHQSTGFQQYVEKSMELSPALEKLAIECQPYYDTLFAEALKA